jgi:uncharacterized protein (TIGR03083 family)
MNDTDLRTQLNLEATRVTEIDPDGLDSPVPWCGDWRVRDVVAHLGGVQRWATHLVENPGTWIRRRDMEPAPPGDASLPWYRDGVAPLLGAFVDTDLDVIVGTWAGDRPRRWWLRRLVHETAMHRWDAEAGATAPTSATPIDAAVAVDGIDELFDNFAPLATTALSGAGETMHLHATDEPGEWLVRFTPDGLAVDHEHAKGDVAVRAHASDLLLLLWNRSSPAEDRFEVFGDVGLVEHWQQRARF